MVIKRKPKMTALVVSAIRNLRELQGSTSKQIMHYIASEYNPWNAANDTRVQKELQTALKRGVEYGILKEVRGHYSLNSDPDKLNQATEGGILIPMERGGCGCASKRGRGRRSARRGRRGRGGRGCKSGSRRRRARRRAAGGGAGCGKRRKGRRKARSGRSRGGCKPRRRSRRGRSAGKCGGGGKRSRRAARRSRRRSRRGKSCSSRGDEEMNALAKEAIETGRHRENNAANDYSYEREERRSQSRGRQSVPSRSRSRSRSRSSEDSDRERNDINRRERQLE